MRISERLFVCAGLTLALAACGSAPEPPASERVACALDGAKVFAEVCRLERDGPRFSVHRPDGGFRRFEPVKGQSIHLIDGADVAQQGTLDGGMVELRIGDDRYRLKLETPGSAAKP